jgi:glycosyltransferase involved in cell wall biosynthesis
MKKKIAIVTCYHQPDYVRAQTLRAALSAQPDVQLVVIKNKHRGLLRYPEVLWQVWRVKRREKPAAFLLTFRGQEILPIMLVLAGRTPLWFDEFIVPAAYAKFEKHKKSPAIMVKHMLSRLGTPLYNLCLRRCARILADTAPHAELSAKFGGVNLSRYLAVPVGADENIFRPKQTAKADPFQIFYYSTGMQPLHGIPVVLEVAERLQDDPVQFVLAGGKLPMKQAVHQAQKNGANIRYESWMNIEDLAETMRASQLSLGGPFGGTRQARNVVTGKTYQSLACQVATVVGSGEATEVHFVDKVNCLMVPQGDADALAAAIRWAVSNQAQLPEIAAAGRALFEKEFSAAMIGRLLRPLVDSL